MKTCTTEAWLRQRGTWATTASILVRDLRITRSRASSHLAYLRRRGSAVRISEGLYVHAAYFPEHAMAILVLLDANGAERHRADFPSRTRAEIALRIVERDIRDRRTSVRVVGHAPTDPLYTVDGVARAMVQPAPQPALADATSESDEPAWDPRSRAAGDDR